jgi:uncharacterized membrane protein
MRYQKGKCTCAWRLAGPYFKYSSFTSLNQLIMLKYIKTTMAIGCVYLFLFSCSKKQAEEVQPASPPDLGTPDTEVTFANFVQPLFQTKCAGCHAPGRSSASIWTFNGISSISTNADRIKDAVIVRKVMPLGGSLSAEELQSLKTWFDKGMQQ